MKETITEWLRRVLCKPRDKPTYRVELEELEVIRGESSVELKLFANGGDASSKAPKETL